MDCTTIRQGQQIFHFLAVLCRFRCVKSNIHTEGALAVQLAVLWVVWLLAPENAATAK